MKKIKDYVDSIKDELEDAKDYAEKYLECKANGNTQNANKYKEMSTDELKHSNYLHEMSVVEINKLNEVYQAPVEMQEEWDKSHKKYIERTAWIKQMLAM